MDERASSSAVKDQPSAAIRTSSSLSYSGADFGIWSFEEKDETLGSFGSGSSSATMGVKKLYTKTNYISLLCSGFTRPTWAQCAWQEYPCARVKSR